MEQGLVSDLRRIEQYEPQALGKRGRSVTADDSRYLQEALGRQVRFNNRIVGVLVVIVLGIFLGIALIWSHRSSSNAVALFQGRPSRHCSGFLVSAKALAG
jgi:hypothetical protein